MIKGIDTSKWQGSKVDYAEALKAGYKFVFLRIGYNTTKDKCFETDYANAKKAGMKVGVYFYTLSQTETQAIADATRVLGWLNGRELDLPVVYDIEDAKQKSASRKIANSEMYNAFSAKITTKYECMLYTGQYFFNTYFDASKITDRLWIARYSDNKPITDKPASIWQYTSSADKSDFYTKALDRNYLLTDYWGIGNTEVIEGNPYAVPTRNLKRTYPMMSGNDVKWLQWELNQKGYGLTVDGKFGNDTKKAVRDYQLQHGLKVDGIVGSATRYSLLND